MTINTSRSQGVAQSFFVENDTGIVITSIDLYFSKKDDSLPVFLEMRPMKNGFPSSEIVMPGSTVVVSSSVVNVSDDASLATTFTFDEPIFLSAKTDYCFVVYSSSKDYNVYISEIGEFELGSTTKRVKSQPYLGSIFLSQNLYSWSAAQNLDLKFSLNRASFKTNVTTEAYFYNSSVPLELLDPNPITVDSGSSTVTVAHRDHGFVVNDTVTILGIDSGDTIGGISGTSFLGDRTITSVDYTGYQFTADSSATSNQIGGGTDVLATRNIRFDLAYPKIEALVPANSTIEFQGNFTTTKSFAGSETAYQKTTGSSGFIDLRNKYAKDFDAPRVIANDAIELSELGPSIKSLDIKAIMASNDSAAAPYIDMQRTAITFQSNVIDNQDSAATSGFNVPLNFVAETDPISGSAASKHVTKTISLEEDAVGLKVILSANRPPEASFQLYYKTGLDETNLNDKNWTFVSQDNSVPADDNIYNYRDYEYTIGGDDGNLTAFTKFKLKIVMNSTNSSKIPMFRDLRAIALSV